MNSDILCALWSNADKARQDKAMTHDGQDTDGKDLPRVMSRLLPPPIPD